MLPHLGRGDAERSECSPCTCGSCRSSQRGTLGSPRLASGAARPRHPRAPFLWIAKERGERKLAPGERPRGFFPRRATPSLRNCPPTGVAGVARADPRPKAPPPACSRQGQKTPRRPPRKNRITPRTGSACLKRSSRIHFTTTRHAASLRPPRNGRIGLNRRIPKRDRGERPGEGQSFIGGIYLRVERC